MQFSLIQAGLIEVNALDGVQDSRPTSSLLRPGKFKLVVDSEPPEDYGAEVMAAVGRIGNHLGLPGSSSAYLSR